MNFVTKFYGLWYIVVCCTSSTSVMEKHSTYFPKSGLRIEQNTKSQALLTHALRPRSIFCAALMAHSFSGPAPRAKCSILLTVSSSKSLGFKKWQPRCLNLNTVTQNMWSCFRCLLASTAPRTVYQHQFKCTFFEMTVSC